MLTSSGEVHGVLGVIVDLNRLGQSLGVTAVALARHVAAFSTARQTDRQTMSHGRASDTTVWSRVGPLWYRSLVFSLPLWIPASV